MSTDTDDTFDQVVLWLRTLPHGAVVAWSQDHMLRGDGLLASWVDVQVPDCEKAVGLNWVWSILAPEDPDLDEKDSELTFSLPQTVDLYEIWDPEEHWYKSEPVATCARGEKPLDDELAAVEDACDEECELVVSHAWKISDLEAGLTAWADQYAGRGDLIFVYDDEAEPSRLVQEAENAMNALESGEAELYDLGNGLKVHEAALDVLLDLGVDEAAELEEQIRKALGLD